MSAARPETQGGGKPGQVVLFLQGPLSPFFARLADRLEARGDRALRVNLCFGDQLFWRRPGAVAYRGSAARWPAFVAELIRREGVTDLVLLGEQRPHHRAAIAAAHAAGVRVSVTDFGYLRPDWIVLERDGMSALSRFPRDPDAIRRLAAASPPADLTRRYADSFTRQATWDVGYHLLSWVMSPLYPGYRSHQIHHPVPNYLATGWRLMNQRRNAAAAEADITALEAAGRPYWLFAMQMEVDYSIRAYSPFADMTEALAEVIGDFARHAPADHSLVVKLHPLDPGLRGWRARVARLARQAGAEGRVVFIDGGALDPLLEEARGVVTVNSTLGLHALQRGAAVKTLGAAIYDVPGLTFQGPLQRFWAEASPPDADLLGAFIRAAADLLHIRGVYYRQPGLNAAVEAAADRLTVESQAAIEARLAGEASPTGKVGI